MPKAAEAAVQGATRKGQLGDTGKQYPIIVCSDADLSERSQGETNQNIKCIR